MGKFNFGDSPVKKMAEELRDGNVEEQIPVADSQVHDVRKGQSDSNRNDNQLLSTENVSEGSSPSFKPVKTKKTENGIVINVPMQDYMQLTMMKIQTGRTLKDLALQAIREFVERNKIE